MRGHGSKQRGFRAKGGDGRGEGVGRVQVERLGAQRQDRGELGNAIAVQLWSQLSV